MRLAFIQGVVLCLMAAVASGGGATGSGSETLRVAVVAPPDGEHFTWAATTQLHRAANDHGIRIRVEAAALTLSSAPQSDLYVMPVRSLATQIPAFQILELPFFYASLDAVQQRLDGALGEYLADAASTRGWEVLAYWDEGMHIFSGLKRYDRARNLKARQFLITRPDPVAELQFQYWKADARRIDPEDREAVLRECLIASRAATLQQVVREQLYRVHLAVTLSNHRYEGWVVVAPAERWRRITDATVQRLRAALAETSAWQRKDAQQREAAALAELRKAGMTIYEMDMAERDAFENALPDRAVLLSDELGMQRKRLLLGLASSGTTTVPGPVRTDITSDAGPESQGEPAPHADSR